MNMKMILSVAAVAVAMVVGASTNYVEESAKRHLVYLVQDMQRDQALADGAAFRTALEELDRVAATNNPARGYLAVSRLLPKTAAAALARCGHFTEKVRKDMLTNCGYDAENKSVDLKPGEAGFANFALQAACGGTGTALYARNGILGAAIVPVRRTIRAKGGTFVGEEGAKLVKAKLDALAAELNAPRFGKADKLLAEIGMGVEWEFIQDHILGDREVAEIRTKLLDGEIAFSTTLQNKLCIALGVDAYNAFVKEYNGDK